MLSFRFLLIGSSCGMYSTKLREEMKRSHLILLTFFLIAFSGLSFNVNAQHTFKTTPKSVIGYLEYLPKDYHTNSSKYPVVIFLHGKGEKGPNTRDKATLSRGISSVEKLGPPYYVKKGTQFPFILISPQLKSNYGDWPLAYIMEVIDHVKKTLRVDPSRIYLTGLSLGGGGVWKAAEERPEIFAAVAPVCGSWNTVSRAKRIADQNLPVWAFHGDKDNTIALSVTHRMIEAINVFKPNPRAKITIYNGVRHEAWLKAYVPDHSIHNQNVYEWMLSHRKKSATSSQQQQQEQKSEEKPANKPPVVSAGADREVSADASRFEISGSGSDPDGKIASWQWTKLSGGNVKMENTNSARLVLKNFSAGVYVFRLTVRDNDGATRTDDVRLTVRASTRPGLQAYAGPDRYLKLPTSYYTISGGATSKDGNITSYQWKQLDGPALKLGDLNSRVLKIYDVKTPGKRTFVLTVRDSKGRAAADHVRITFSK